MGSNEWPASMGGAVGGEKLGGKSKKGALGFEGTWKACTMM